MLLSQPSIFVVRHTWMKDLGVNSRINFCCAVYSEAADLQTNYSKRCIAVSTLAEAEFYSENGFDDILLAHPVSENKIDRWVACFQNLCSVKEEIVLELRAISNESFLTYVVVYLWNCCSFATICHLLTNLPCHVCWEIELCIGSAVCLWIRFVLLHFILWLSIFLGSHISSLWLTWVLTQLHSLLKVLCGAATSTLVSHGDQVCEPRNIDNHKMNWYIFLDCYTYSSSFYVHLINKIPWFLYLFFRCLALMEKISTFHVMVSNKTGMDVLETAVSKLPTAKKWSIMLEIDAGYGRSMNHVDFYFYSYII